MGTEPSFTAVHDFVEYYAQTSPEAVAVLHESESRTYSELNGLANQLAHYLSAKGIQRGDRIGLFLENSIEYLAGYIGIMKAGGIAVPFNTDLKPDKILPLIEKLEPRAMISNFKMERKLKATALKSGQLDFILFKNQKLNWGEDPVCPILDWDGELQNCSSENIGIPTNSSDLANIIFTSGSTGLPKGVMLSHQNIVSNTQSICEYLRLTSKDTQMVVLPFFYVMGQSLMNSCFCSGGRLVLNNKFAYPATVIQQMVEEKVTGFAGVPSTYAYLMNRSPLEKEKENLSSLRFCAQAGGHMPGSHKKKLREILPESTDIFIMYGATEASARLAYVPPEKLADKLESIGIPIPGVTLAVRGKDGGELGPGETGEIVGRGDNIMQGYWNEPEATQKVLDKNGYHTGDMGYYDEEGYFFVSGRKDSLLKVGGHRINPIEVEDTLVETELVMEASVVGVEDEMMGNRLVALAVPLEESTDPKTVLAQLAKSLANYKMPSELKFTKALPKNSSGKVDKKACLDFFKSEPSGAPK